MREATEEEKTGGNLQMGQKEMEEDQIGKRVSLRCTGTLNQGSGSRAPRGDGCLRLWNPDWNHKEVREERLMGRF